MTGAAVAAPLRVGELLERQRHREARRWRFLALFAGLILCSLTLDVATGPSLLGVREVLATLLSPASADAMTRAIVMDVRGRYDSGGEFVP